ncbi:DNA-binding protein [Streptomyces calidiresistens]|uniref:Helix-turn-helix domain-containing protein n=1 Tax=Streptomyces calidiresistens TaxID=1485586 RepID=A0A7W3T1K4_9ACTN|nr:helix-turn-helix transcriptional regulator [Streptomyces calidiresistens]MBB0229232.1 helix-turn-helix domain-containing protein [Streptomyces calidiresistens]
MTTDDWSAQLTARVAEQIRAARKAAGLTVAETADACAALGAPVQKTTITNLETGRRASVDLAELLVLARVLGVPPVALLFPLGSAPTVEVLPGREVPVWDGLAWFTGETPLRAPAPENSARHLLDTFRAHSDAVATAIASTELAKERRRKATTTLDPARRAALLEVAASYEELAAEDRRELRALRQRMRENGLQPPPLPDEVRTAESEDAR